MLEQFLGVCKPNFKYELKYIIFFINIYSMYCIVIVIVVVSISKDIPVSIQTCILCVKYTKVCVHRQDKSPSKW